MVISKEENSNIILYLPESLKEALEVISREETIILSGGTDLMVRRKRPSGLIPRFDKNTIFVANLAELKKIYTLRNYLHIGAACTFSEISNYELIPDYFKIVIKDIASPAIRNVATIGGNICNASPAADILPLLYALEAELVVGSLKGDRIIFIEDFIVAPGRNVLGSDEILKEIRIPIVNFNEYYYKKVGTRKATAISKLSFIGFINVEEDVIKDVRIAFGAVAPTIVKSKKMENELIGKNINNLDEISEELIEDYSDLINPIDDQRSNKNYRKQVAVNLLKDFLKLK